MPSKKPPVGAKIQPFAIRQHKRTLVQLLIIGFLLYAVIAGFSGLGRSVEAVRSASSVYIAGAALAVAASYLFAALTYVLLSSRPIPYAPTLLVQISSGLVNRLLPAGLGGLGINLLYLKKRGYSVTTAAAVVATNNSLGFVGNILLVLGAGIVFPLNPPDAKWPAVPMSMVIVAACVVAVTSILILRSHTAARTARTSLREIASFAGSLSRRPFRSLAALLSSCALTGAHAAAMYLVLQAVSVDLPWPIALVAISAGALAGAAVPTPGGLGGAEAGIAAVVIGFGVSAPTAVAAALIYRGLTYWLPLLPGYAALRVVEKRYIY